MIERDGRRIAPLHRAPWVDRPEEVPAEVAPHLGLLQGDFFCAPFGAPDEAGVPGARLGGERRPGPRPGR